MRKRHKSHALPKDPFAFIAFWQLMTFFILVLLVWVNELRGGALFFDTEPDEVNIFRGFILTAAILVTAIITVGNTYLQQRRVVKSLVSVCAGCRRVRLNDQAWQQLEDYIGERSLLTFQTSLCPDCSKELMKKIGNNSPSQDCRSDKSPSGPFRQNGPT